MTAPEHRQLVAIMFTDIVGYSALMGTDEAKALACVAHQRALFQPLIQLHKGQLHKEMGDGTLSSFASANDAIACASAIQAALGQQPDYKVRIGLHIGEAVFTNDDIYGDGVNIAARLEPLAEPGGIVVSGAFHDAVRSKLDLNFHCLGEKSLKNIGRSMTVYQLLAPGAKPPRPVPVQRARRWRPWLAGGAATLAAVVLAWRLLLPSAATNNSIAVLPFADLSQAKDQEYFSDGLSEELLSMLSKLPQLKVIARTSSFAFKGKENDVRAIANTLGVAHILVGSVRKSGNTLRITTQLVRASDSAQLWSETYDRQLTDVFKVQDEIAGAVVAALKVKLLPAQQVTNQHRTKDTEAYQYYLLGNQHLNRNTPDGYRRGVQAYRAALDIDPGYAAAHAGLAFAEHESFRFNDQPQTAEQVAQAKQRAIAAAEKAIAVAPDLAQGYAARGFIRTFTLWDWNGALMDYQKALSLDPADSNIERRYGLLLAIMGKLPEAIASTKKAIEIDPLSMFAWSNIGSYYNATGQLVEARKALNRALEISANSHHASSYLGQNALMENRPADALPYYLHAGEVNGLTGTAMAQHSLGHAGKSQQALDELIAKHTQDRAFRIALVYAWRGDKDKSFAWMDRAFAQHDTDLAYIKYEPLLAPVRSDARFAAMVGKIGLPP